MAMTPYSQIQWGLLTGCTVYEPAWQRYFGHYYDGTSKNYIPDPSTCLTNVRNYIKQIQTALNTFRSQWLASHSWAPYSILAVDGIYGTNTINAVKYYQQNSGKGLAVDGLTGQNTWMALSTV